MVLLKSALAKCQQHPSTPSLCSNQVWLGDKGAICVLSGLRHSRFLSQAMVSQEPSEGLGAVDRKKAWRGTAGQSSLTPCYQERQSHLLHRHPVEQKSKHPVLLPPPPPLLSSFLCLGPQGLKHPFREAHGYELGPASSGTCVSCFVHSL